MGFEERAAGTVGWDVWMRYIIVLLLSTERFVYITCDWWMSTWSGAAYAPPNGDWNLDPATTIDDQHYYMHVYLTLALIICSLSIIRVILFAELGAWAASILFQRLVKSVFRSPMVFFETTPIGRIIARLAYGTIPLRFFFVSQSRLIYVYVY
jgi:hypothetical protein